MRPTEFSNEAIIEAGCKLELALAGTNKRVTGFALRKELGGGQQSRLTAVWEAYKAQGITVEKSEDRVLPIEIEDSLSKFSETMSEQIRALAITMNNQAHRIAERRVAEMAERGLLERNQFIAEIDDASGTIEELEKEVDQVNKQVEQWQTRAEAAQEGASRAQAELAASTERERSLLAELEILRPLRQLVRDLEGEVAQLRPLKEANTEMRGTLQAQTAEIATLKADNASLTREDSRLRERATKLDEQHLRDQVELNALRETKAQLDQLRISHDALADHSSDLKGQLQAAAVKIQSLENDVVQAHERREQAQRDLGRQIKDLHDQVKSYTKLLEPGKASSARATKTSGKGTAGKDQNPTPPSKG